MKKIGILIGLLIITGYSFGQFDIDLCKDIIWEKVDLKSCQNIKVVQSGTAVDAVSFSAATTEFRFSAKYIKITDQSGRIMYITYESIKAMYYCPKEFNRTPYFSIFLKE